jgi:hypothetical protein
MNNPQFTGPDAVRSRLRAAMSMLERAIASLPKPTGEPGGATTPSALVAAFDDLAKQLALGPDPELRACPSCKQFGMRAATRCGNCWTRLTPPERDAAVG